MFERAMCKQVSLSVDGKTIVVPTGTTVAVAVVLAGEVCRRSVTGEVRSAVCGMGICFECRVTIGQEAYRRSCQILCEPGMDVKTRA
jgi:sarcosine oxidase subunit alpha